MARRVRTSNARTRSASRREQSPVTIKEEAYGRQKESTKFSREVRFEPGQEPAFVHVSAGGTYNLGNFESLRLDVSVTLPCLPSEVEDAFREATGIVGEELAEQETRWLGSRTKKARSRD